MDVYLDLNLRRILKTSLEAILSAQYGRYCIHNLLNTLLFFLAMPPALHETHLYLANFFVNILFGTTSLDCSTFDQKPFDSPTFDHFSQGWPNHCPGAKKCPPRLFHVPSKLFLKNAFFKPY